MNRASALALFASFFACASRSEAPPAKAEQPWPPRFSGEWTRACEVHEVCAEALRGCEAGDDTWCLALGAALEGYGGPRDPSAALAVYLTTCYHEVAEACSQAALVLALEAPDERSHVRALHERACKGGVQPSCAALRDHGQP